MTIDRRIHDLYDRYCHGAIDRREFLDRAATLTVVGGVSGLAMAQALLPRYAEAQTISFTDPRIKATYVTYESPGGTGEEMRAYLVRPAGDGPFPAVIVIHENRGLNPHIEDVARRAAVAGFLTLAPDALSPIGGYPGNDDDGRTMQSGLDVARMHEDFINGARYIRAHALSNGRLGAVGFCFGGGMVNQLAVELGTDLDAGVPFYGPAPASEDVSRIEAAMQIHYAEDDQRINAGKAAYEEALAAQGITFEMHLYPGTHHGFHNNSTPRFDEDAARLAWQRTVAFLDLHLRAAD